MRQMTRRQNGDVNGKTLTDDDIVTRRIIQRRSFVAGATASLAGAIVMIYGASPARAADMRGDASCGKAYCPGEDTAPGPYDGTRWDND